MESLYRKYRPQTFDDVVGQTSVTETLKRAVTEKKISHGYLFCGPRGTGKTTMARILAKALVCSKGAGSLPDGTCEQCLQVAAGNHPDVYELDAASRTGVDAVREEIVNRVDFAPVQSNSQVYIIDEVHMLTTQAFNALLKTLEEPPSHVYFILCTTDPQKVIPTILSRVQRFDFTSIADEDIQSRLEYVCKQEGFSADVDALQLIARHASGGMRDALASLEQASVFSNGAITLDDVRSLLGETDDDFLNDVVSKIASKDAPALLQLIDKKANSGSDLQLLCTDIASRLRDIYVASFVNAPACDSKIKELSKSFESSDAIASALQVMGDCALNLRGALNPKILLDCALIKICSNLSTGSLSALEERLDKLEQMLNSGAIRQVANNSGYSKMESSQIVSTANYAKPKPQVQPQPPVTQIPQVKPQPPVTQIPQVKPVQTHMTPAPAPTPNPVPKSSAVSQQFVSPQPAAVAQEPAVKAAPFSDQEISSRWSAMLLDLRQASPAICALISGSRATHDTGDTIEVHSNFSKFVIDMLAKTENKKIVDSFVLKHIGKRSLKLVADSADEPRSVPETVTSVSEDDIKILNIPDVTPVEDEIKPKTQVIPDKTVIETSETTLSEVPSTVPFEPNVEPVPVPVVEPTASPAPQLNSEPIEKPVQGGEVPFEPNIEPVQKPTAAPDISTEARPTSEPAAQTGQPAPLSDNISQQDADSIALLQDIFGAGINILSDDENNNQD